MRFLCRLLLLAPLFSAGRAEPVPPGQGAEVKKVGETLYRIGEIEFDAKTREIRFPVTVNMREGGPMEYLLVHERGKVHESVFTTAVSPTNLQIALKLLRFESGEGDVFNRLLPPELLEKEGGEPEGRGDTVFFTFTEDGADHPIPVYELVIDGEGAGPMVPGGWIYSGSFVEGGTFMAEAEGSIIAIYLDRYALFNTTRDGADIDSRWGARTSMIPEIGTKGILAIQLIDISVVLHRE